MASQHYLIRWSDDQTKDLLAGVLIRLKVNPALFEKPTVETFYEEIAGDYPSLSKLPVAVLIGKMRKLQMRYVAFTTSSVFEANEQRQKFPFFEELNEIFKLRFKPKICQSKSGGGEPLAENEDNSEKNAAANKSASDFKDEGIESQGSVPTLKSGTSLMGINSNSTLEIASLLAEDFNMCMRREAPNDAFEAFLSLRTKQLELDTKKLELENRKERNLTYHRKIQRRHEFRLRNLELESRRKEMIELEQLRLESRERLEKYKSNINFLMGNTAGSTEEGMSNSKSNIEFK